MKYLTGRYSHAMPQRQPHTKKVLEKDIQRKICDWLFSRKYFFWRHNTIPVWEKGHFRALPKYTPRGLPDIMVISSGKFIGLEVKTPHYWKRTDDQIKMKDAIINNGGHYHLVTSLEEVVDLMRRYDKDYIPPPFDHETPIRLPS